MREKGEYTLLFPGDQKSMVNLVLVALVQRQLKSVNNVDFAAVLCSQ